MKAHAIFLALLLVCGVVNAQNSTLLGLPFDIHTPDSTVKKTVDHELTNLTHMNTSLEIFRRYKNHKALAINYELITGMSNEPYYYVASWGAAWEYKTLDSAIFNAIKECKMAPNYREKGNILLLMLDDRLNIPDSLYKKFKDFESDIGDRERIKFELANRLVPLNLAADQTISLVDVQNGRLGNRADSIKLNAGYPNVYIGYPDRKQDYADACQDRVFYALQPVVPADTSGYFKALTRLSKIGLYGMYNRSVNTVMNFNAEVKGRQMEKMAKFSAHLNLEKEPLKLVLPYNLRLPLQNEKIKEIWVEGAVRVTDDWMPLEKDSVVKPLAILTDRNLYVALEVKMPDTHSYCALSEDFHNKVIDITFYKNDEAGRQKVYQVLMANLEKQFAGRPLGAQKIQKPYPPGEMWMVREGLPSLVLGEPYYETSTYSFRIYYADEGPQMDKVYNRESFHGVSNKNVKGDHAYLFLYVTNVSSAKPHKNDRDYIEIRGDDQAKFYREINASIAKAIQQSCTDLQGKMNVTICAVK